MKYFKTFTWIVLSYNIAVILWGAYVRATGSGAGCGSHWPLCNGEVLPRAPQIETVIEFAHRASSGLALILVAALLVLALRIYPKGHTVRLGAALSAVFILTEALLGAGLVLFEWVARDESTARVISMAAHLANTFLLLAALTLTAWWASGGAPISLKSSRPMLWGLGLGFLGVILLGMSGAVTALGDTLFPVGSLAEGIARDFSPTAHITERLRVWHPVIAITTGLYLIFVTGLVALFREGKALRRFAVALIVLFLIQLGAGLLNLVLRAPVAMQIVHLLLADLVWITLVLFSATAFAVPAAQPSPAARPAADTVSYGKTLEV